MPETTLREMLGLAASRWKLAALGLLPALALVGVLVGNWIAGGAPVEALQKLGGPLLVDVEPDAPMRILGELEPMEGAQQLRVRYCGTECQKNMQLCVRPPTESPGRLACREMMVSKKLFAFVSCACVYSIPFVCMLS